MEKMSCYLNESLTKKTDRNEQNQLERGKLANNTHNLRRQKATEENVRNGACNRYNMELHSRRVTHESQIAHIAIRKLRYQHFLQLLSKIDPFLLGIAGQIIGTNLWIYHYPRYFLCGRYLICSINERVFPLQKWYVAIKIEMKANVKENKTENLKLLGAKRKRTKLSSRFTCYLLSRFGNHPPAARDSMNI